MDNNGERKLYLHEAMELVLKEQPDKTMSMKDLSDEIWRRQLYKQKCRAQAPDYQMRLRAMNHEDKFDIIGNKFIKLL